ncbi:MAG: family 78 glycoside hydrolase catalytic domain [Candidatus Hinthialibacter antarcticus]|nr:family 78 glycoside hydrolase catalytic domain [Candidatus Hinthialibacter antarcticus]
MNFSLQKTAAVFFIFLGYLGAMAAADALTAQDMRTEYLVNPIGIDETQPRLSWKLDSDENGALQTAYQICVASSDELLHRNQFDLWDSGKTESSQSVNIAYQGAPLQSRQHCFWKVRVWGQDGRASHWSSAAHWSMGLLSNEDWKAEWTSFKDDAPMSASRENMVLPPARYYRKTFVANKPIKRAMAYASALGIYELSINGKRVSDQMFTPGWSDYRERVYYNAFDVTSLVQSKQNAIGAIVADGWYSGYLGYGLLVGYGPNQSGRNIYGKTPALLAQLEIEYTDGTSEIIATDASWKTRTGPIVKADMLMGETYDARLEQPGWNQPGFDDAQWESAIPAKDNGSTKAVFTDQAGKREMEFGFIEPKQITAYPSVPIRPTEKIKPIEITEPSPGTFIFNMGQNFSGVVQIKVKGKRGDTIVIRHGEMLHPDGRLMTENLRRAQATDTYILRGDSQPEIWEPRFTYHGFQYVELTGLTEKPSLNTVTGIAIHSDTPLTSSFACSDPMVNQLFKNIVWTQRSNFFEVPTDCPQRDERFGWTGDAQTYIRTASYNADVAAFFTKWLDDLEEAQLPNGAYPDYAPYPMMHGKPHRGFATAWMDAGIICPWTIYKVYGDVRVIERHYESMTRFMQFRQTNSPDFLGVNIGNGWGDWLALGDTAPVEYVDTVYFALSARMMAEMADAIGESDDAKQYRELYSSIKNAFAAKYLSDDGRIKHDYQTSYSLALFAGLVSEEQTQAASDRLVELINENDVRMSTGFLGTRPLLTVLTRHGNNDLAARLLQSRRYPSWGYEVENGATTIWERWNSYTKEDGFASVSMNSFSHYAFGAVCEWMFQSLAGIDCASPGYKEIIIDPHPPEYGSNPEQEPIHWVKASVESIHGAIGSEWKNSEAMFELSVRIPANTTAHVYVPAANLDQVQLNGKELSRQRDVILVRTENEKLVFFTPSGEYSFKVIK